jgi:hypothetical protein
MSNEMTVYNPFARQANDSIAAGAVSIESDRAVAEAQGSLILAKRFPRDPALCFTKAMDACKRPSLAGVAFYSFKRGSEIISGPTIRLAEELARCWGNIDFGTKELSRKIGAVGQAGESEMMAFAWDKETNTMSSQSFTVRHTRDKTGGATLLTSDRDIYEKTANEGARRLRARILAVLPPDLIEGAIQQCKLTLQGGSEMPLSDRINRMVAAFGKLGVTPQMLIEHLGHPIADTTPDELGDLIGFHNAIRDKQATIDEIFGKHHEEVKGAAAESVAKLKAAAQPGTKLEPQSEQQDKPKVTARTQARRQMTDAEAAAAPAPQAAETKAEEVTAKAAEPAQAAAAAAAKTAQQEQDDF